MTVTQTALLWYEEQFMFSPITAGCPPLELYFMANQPHFGLMCPKDVVPKVIKANRFGMLLLGSFFHSVAEQHSV